MSRVRRKSRRKIVRYLLLSLPVYAILISAGLLLYSEPSAEELILRGCEAARSQDHGLALECFNKALALSPDDKRIYWYRAKSNEVMQRFEAALADYEEYRRLDPTSERALNDIGWLLTQKGDHQKAIERFEEAGRRFPESSSKYQFNAGRVYYAWHQQLATEIEESLTKIARPVMDPEPILEAAGAFLVDLENAHTVAEVLDQLPQGVIPEELADLQVNLLEANDCFRKARASLEPVSYAEPSASNFNHGALVAELDYHAGRLDQAKLTCDMMLAIDKLMPRSQAMSPAQRIKFLQIRANIHSDLERFDLSAVDFAEIEKLYRSGGSGSEAFQARQLELQDRLESGQAPYVLENTRALLEATPEDVLNAYLHARAQQMLGDLSGAVQTSLAALKQMARGALMKTVRRHDDRVKVVFGFYDILNAGSRWNEALRMLDALLNLEPNNIEALEKRAIFYEVRLNDSTKAGQDYFRILQLTPRDSASFAAWDRVNLRRLTGGSGNLEPRIKDASARWHKYRSILTAPEPSPTDWREKERQQQFLAEKGSLVWDLEHDQYLLYRLALHFMENQNVEEGLLILSKLAYKYPRVHEFSFRLAQVAYARHQYEDALGRVVPILERNPADADAARYAVLCFRHLGRHEEEAAVEAALARAAPESDGRVAAIRSALRSGAIERAERILLAGLAHFPASPDLAALRGRLLLAKEPEQTKQARALFGVALQKNPFQFDALAGMVQIACLEQDDAALRQLVSSLHLAPIGTVEDDLVELADLLTANGKAAIAADFLHKARNRFPYSQGLVAALGRVYVRLGRLEDAENYLAKADENDWSDPPHDLFLVRLEREGFDKATRFLQDTRGSRPGAAAMPAHIAIGHALRGSRREAHRFLLKAREAGVTEDPAATLMLLTRVLLSIDPISTLPGLPPQLGAAPPLDPLAGQPNGLRQRDFDWLVDLGLRDAEALRAFTTEIARCLIHSERPVFAEYAWRAIEKAYELQPSCGLVARTYARELARRGAEGRARELLLDQIRKDPNDDQSITALVDLLRTTIWDPDELAFMVKELVQVVGMRSEIRYLGARAAALAGQAREAIQTLQILSTQDPHYVPALLDLAKIYQNEGLNDAAERSLRAAVKSNPDNEEARRELVRFWKAQPAEWRRPVDFLLPLLKKNPTLFEFYGPLIESLGREEDGAGMARALATWLEPATRNVLPPESFEALIATGSALLAGGQSNPAEVLIQRARRLDPLSPDSLEAIGKLDDKRGRFREAATSFDLLDKLYGAPPEVQARLAYLKFHILRERQEGAKIAAGAVARSATPDPQALEVLAAWALLNDKHLSAAAFLERTRPTHRQEVASLAYRIGVIRLAGGDLAGAARHLGHLRAAEAESDLRLQHAAFLVQRIAASAQGGKPPPKPVAKAVAQPPAPRPIPQPAAKASVVPERSVLEPEPRDAAPAPDPSLPEPPEEPPPPPDGEEGEATEPATPAAGDGGATPETPERAGGEPEKKNGAGEDETSGIPGRLTATTPALGPSQR
ncbi:MAG: tetratricopeptide repeat protein [Planctomycetota bacterium]